MTLEKSIFSLLLTEPNCESEQVMLANANTVLCNKMPCYLAENVSLEADAANKIPVYVDADIFYNKMMPTASKLVHYVELDPTLTGMYPNTGIIDATLPQEITMIAGHDQDIPQHTQIGFLCTAFVEQHPSHAHSDWIPNEDVMYSILTDQQVVDAINSAGPENCTSKNPTAVLDKITKFDNVAMMDTPEEYAIGHHARLFPPRDMLLFDKQHEEWEKNPQPDGLPDEWTMDRIKKEFILPDNVLTEEQKQEFYKIIHKYRVSFTRNPADLHLSTIGEIDLVLKPGEHKNLSVKPSRWSPETNLIIKDILEGYLKSGIIKHSSGPYSSRVFITYRRATEETPKPKARLVIDYRNINAALIPCSKYLAGVEDLLLKVKNHKWYSKLDLKGAYHQVGVIESKKDITSIVTVESQYAFNVMSFGLSIAPGYFEAFMEACFKYIPDAELSHYLDDCIIPADNVEDMLSRLTNFLHTVTKHRIKLCPEKCQYFKSEISFLGFILNQDGMKKSEEYIERIKKTPKPRTVHALMQFLGLVNFQRRFVKHCSYILKPLIDAVEHKAKNIKKKEVNWTDEMENAFEQIKIKLAEDVSLAFPETSQDAKPLQLYVDASDYALGATLMQEQQGVKRPISFTSKLFSKAELRYSSYDKEILALVRGIAAHRQYLIGHEFFVYTDCKNLVYLYKMKNACPRLLRLLEQLSEYNFTLEHIAGVDNYTSQEECTPSELNKKLVTAAPSEYIPPGFTEILVPGGAEAPFETISKCLEHTLGKNVSPEELRHELITEIINNAEKYKVKGKPGRMQELKAMLQTGVSTYIIVFQAAANIYKTNFIIYFGIEQPLVFRPQERKNEVNKEIFPDAYAMCRGQGCHYNVLQPQRWHSPEGSGKNESYFLATDFNSELDDEISENSEECETNELTSTTQTIEILAQSFQDGANEPEGTIEDNIFAQLNIGKDKKTSLYSDECFLQDTNFFLPAPTFSSCCYLGSHALSDFCFQVNSSKTGAVNLCVGADTGASLSIISESAYKILSTHGFAKAAQKIPPNSGCIKIIGSETYTRESTEVTLPFWEYNTKTELNHEFYILKDKNCSSCLLLGMDFLQKYTLKLHFNARTIFLNETPSIATPKGSTLTLKMPNYSLIETQNQVDVITSKHIYINSPIEIVATAGLETSQTPEHLEDFDFPFSLDSIHEIQQNDKELKILREAVDKENEKKCPFLFKRQFKNIKISWTA